MYLEVINILQENRPCIFHLVLWSGGGGGREMFNAGWQDLTSTCHILSLQTTFWPHENQCGNCLGAGEKWYGKTYHKQGKWRRLAAPQDEAVIDGHVTLPSWGTCDGRCLRWERESECHSALTQRWWWWWLKGLSQEPKDSCLLSGTRWTRERHCQSV